MTDIDRRTFLTGLSAASAFTIVPRRVLGGQGFVAPSDMILSGAGGLRAAVAAPGQHRLRAASGRAVRGRRRSQPRQPELRRLEQFGNRNQIRRFLEDPQWGAGDKGIRGGREVAREIMETYYRKQQRPRRHSRLRRLSRDAREGDRHPGRHQHHARPPARQHQHRRAAGRARRQSRTSRSPSVLYEVRRTLQAARESSAVSHLLAYSNSPDRHTLAAWIQAGAIGTVREVHNWTDRPFWPQGMQEYHASGAGRAGGFNWALWQGPEPERPYHPSYTFAVYRGWYAYGTGCLGDMGHYSLWQPYRILEPRRAGVGRRAARTTRRGSTRGASARGGRVSTGRLSAGEQRPLAAPRDRQPPAVDTFWYDGGMKPQTPEELYADGEDLAAEGMLIVGDQGKILCDFRGNAPRLLPQQPPAGVRGFGHRARVRRDERGRRVGQRDQDRQEVQRQLRGGGARSPKP